MAGINRYETPAEQNVVNTYVPLPYHELAYSLANKQHQYDEGEAQQQANLDNFLKVQALQKDTTKRDELIDAYRKDASAKYDAVRGDYSQLGSYAKGQAQKIKSDLAYGQLGAIHNNYAAAQKYQEDQHDRFVKGDITAEQYKRALEHSHETYQGVGEKTNGKYNSFNGYESANFQNLGEQALKITDGWKADGTVSPPRADGKVFLSTKNEWVDKNEVYNAAYKSLKSNKMNQDFVNEEVLFSGKGVDLNKLDHNQANKGILTLQKMGIISSNIDPNQLTAQQKYSLLKEHDIYHQAVSPAADKASYDKKDNTWKFNPEYLLSLKHQKANDISGVGSSYTEVIPNSNHKDILPGIEMDNNGRMTTTGYKKIVNGKEVNISEKEYKDQYNTLINKYKLKSGENALSAGAGTSGEGDQEWKKFNDTYKVVKNDKVSAVHLYDINQDFRNLALKQAKMDFKKYQDHFSDSDSKNYPNPYVNGKLTSGYLDNFAKVYKETVNTNKEIPLTQENFDSEQVNNNGGLTLANLQSGTFTPLDDNAKALTKQKGGDLDYTQLTQDGWQPVKVINSGRVHGTGMKGNNLAERSVITLKKGEDTKTVTVLSRTNHEGMQNSREAHTINALNTILQSKHDGAVPLGENLVANVEFDYTGQGTTLNYTHRDGSPVSQEDLQKNNINFTTLDELRSYLKERLLKHGQSSGIGAVGTKSEKTRDYDTYQDE